MATVDEISILRAKVKDLESKFNRVSAFVSASAELIADQKRFLEKGEKVLQTFISGLKNNGVQSEGGAQVGLSTKQSSTTCTHSNPPQENTVESLPVQVSTFPITSGPVSSQSKNTAETLPPPASTTAPIQGTSTSVVRKEDTADRSREEKEGEEKRKKIPTRVHSPRLDSKSTSEGSPPKVAQTPPTVAQIPPKVAQIPAKVAQIPAKVAQTPQSPTSPKDTFFDESLWKRDLPRRTVKKPMRYGSNLYDNINSETPDNASDTDESEEEPTENPMLALGLIPKPVFEETFFESSNDSLEVKVEEMEMPILEQIEATKNFQELELRGGAMPTLATVSESRRHRDAYDNPHARGLVDHSNIQKSPVQTTSKRNLQVGEAPLNKKLAAAISANNKWLKIRKSRRPDASKKKKSKQLGDKSSPHICDLCGQKLRSLHGLKAHIRSHSGAKPFQCNRCQARFSQKSSLNRHIMVHTGEKNFICPACDKAFITRYDLLIHSRVHTRKSQECPSCFKIFFDPRYFNGHVKACSSAQVNKCPKCAKVLKDPKYFRKHVLLCV